MILHIFHFPLWVHITTFVEACFAKLFVYFYLFIFIPLPDARLQKQPRLVDATLPAAKKAALWIKSLKARWRRRVNTVYLFIYFFYFAACRKRAAERSPHGSSLLLLLLLPSTYQKRINLKWLVGAKLVWIKLNPTCT